MPTEGDHPYRNLSLEWDHWHRYYREKGLGYLHAMKLAHKKMRKLYGVG